MSATVTNAADELLDTGPAAGVIGVAANTLSVWRMHGRHNLPFIKIGSRVKYRRSDLEKWLAARTGTSTTQITAALA